MKCFIYRYPEDALIRVSAGEFTKYDEVDPIDHIEQLARSGSLKHARVNRSVTVCVENDTEAMWWELAVPVSPFMEYQGYP